MKKRLLLFAATFIVAVQLMAQVSINSDGSQPDSAAMLEVKSTTKGFLPPRMTTGQMNGIRTPPDGLIVYNTSVNSLYWFNGSMWKKFNEFSYTETDPIFGAHPSSGITSQNISDWNIAYISRINYVSGTNPLVLDFSNNQLTGYINVANSVNGGYLTSADWNIFNGKQNALSFGSVTSADLSVSGGNNAVIGSGMNLTINKGNITSSDLTISGGSNAVLGTGTSLTIKKGNLSEATSSVLTISGGTNAILGTATTIQVKQATASQSGYLSSTDWNTFNSDFRTSDYWS